MTVAPLDVALRDSVATITFNVPMLNRRSMPALLQALQEVDADPAVRAVILTGRHHVFLSGADLKEVATLRTRSDVLDFLAVPIRIVQALRSSSCVSFAAINGFCLGGGLEIAMACDFRHCADTLPAHLAQSEFIGFPEVRRGLTPGAGGAYLAGKTIGHGHLSKLILTGKAINAETAYRIGLVHEVHARTDLLREVETLANSLLRENLTDVRTSRQTIHGDGFEQELKTKQQTEADAFASSLLGVMLQDELTPKDLGALRGQTTP